MFYSIEDFEFNHSWQVSICPYRNDVILHIDEVYKKPYKVYEYLKQCPIRAHRLTEADPTSKNGKLFYKGFYKDGIKEGKWEHYNFNGILMEHSGMNKNGEKIGD